MPAVARRRRARSRREGRGVCPAAGRRRVPARQQYVTHPGEEVRGAGGARCSAGSPRPCTAARSRAHFGQVHELVSVASAELVHLILGVRVRAQVGAPHGSDVAVGVAGAAARARAVAGDPRGVGPRGVQLRYCSKPMLARLGSASCTQTRSRRRTCAGKFRDRVGQNARGRTRGLWRAAWGRCSRRRSNRRRSGSRPRAFSKVVSVTRTSTARRSVRFSQAYVGRALMHHPAAASQHPPICGSALRTRVARGTCVRSC